MSGYAQMQMHAVLARYLRWPKTGNSRTGLPQGRHGRTDPTDGPAASGAAGLGGQRNDEGHTPSETNRLDR
jgi:hypothetical protein